MRKKHRAAVWQKGVDLATKFILPNFHIVIFFSAVKQINFISPVGKFVFVDSAAAM